jgi:two-component system NtrC family sensor kinase
MPDALDQEARADRLAQQLKEKEAIINGISDALMVLDGSTYEILEVNQAFLAYYGVSRDEVLGKHCYEITHHLSKPCHQSNEYCPCPLADSLTTGNESRVEHAHKSSDGETLYSEIIAYPLKDLGGQVTRIIHLTRDITQRKHLEFQLQEKEKLTGILELAGGASHEMNQPLTVIISGLEQLIKRLPPESETHELARLILDHARRLTEVSTKLAGITRYASMEYVEGTRILDLDRASDKEPES